MLPQKESSVSADVREYIHVAESVVSVELFAAIQRRLIASGLSVKRQAMKTPCFSCHHSDSVISIDFCVTAGVFIHEILTYELCHQCWQAVQLVAIYEVQTND